MVVCRMHIIFKVEKTACSFLLFHCLKFYGKVRNTIGRQQYAIVEDCTLGNGTLYLDWANKQQESANIPSCIFF